MASFPRAWQVLCLMSGALLCAQAIHMGEVEEHPHAEPRILSVRKGENNGREAEKATDAAVQAADATGALRRPKSAKKAKSAKKEEEAEAEEGDDAMAAEDAAAEAAKQTAADFGASDEEQEEAAEKARDAVIAKSTTTWAATTTTTTTTTTPTTTTTTTTTTTSKRKLPAPNLPTGSAAGSGASSAASSGAGSGSAAGSPTPAPTTDRQLVADGSGACDEIVFADGEEASCHVCSLYADGRSAEGEDGVKPEEVGAPCQYVPSEKLCYPQFWVEEKSMTADTECEDSESKTSEERTDAPGKCDDVESPSCMVCNKFKDGRKPPNVDEEEAGSHCEYVSSENKCLPAFWVQQESLEADTECKEERVAAEGKCDDVESPSCMNCNKFKDGRDESDLSEGQDTGSPCQYAYSEDSCFPEWWVKSEGLETDTECEADREPAVAKCDNVQEPSCEECNKFKDGRKAPNVDEEETGSACQYVPSEKKCYPAFWVDENSLETETEC